MKITPKRAVNERTSRIEIEDVELYDGTMGYYASGLAKMPLVPGHEWAGPWVEQSLVLSVLLWVV